MDLDALERTIKALEQSLDSLGVWLALWTALVVLGLIVEYAEDLKDLINERPFKWKLFRTMVGGLLITAGVAGELIIQFKASKLETALRTNSHQVEALLNQEAADANERAAKANERAAKLEAALSWRNLSPAQHDKLVSSTKHVLGVLVSPVSFDSVVGSPEAKRYGDQLSSALSEAGVSSTGPRGTSSCVECTGVWVCVNQNAGEVLFERAQTLRKLLEESGVKATKYCTDPKNGLGPSETIKIIVGPKE